MRSALLACIFLFSVVWSGNLAVAQVRGHLEPSLVAPLAFQAVQRQTHLSLALTYPPAEPPSYQVPQVRPTLAPVLHHLRDLLVPAAP